MKRLAVLTICLAGLSLQAAIVSDISGDGFITSVDLEAFLADWLDFNFCDTVIPGDVNGDCRVDAQDFGVIADEWLSESAGAVEYALRNRSFESPVLSSSNSYYSGVQGWGTVGNIGTTYLQPASPSTPCPDGDQYAWADVDSFHLFQQVGTIEPDTWYTFSVDVFPLRDHPSNTAEIVIEETDNWIAIMAGKYYHPGWDINREDFQMPPQQWTTVTLSFNSAAYSHLYGHNMRVRVFGYHMAVDNARFYIGTEPSTYYISASQGDDNNDGKSEATAWQTFNNINGITLQPGDKVLLKRGDTWYEELHLSGKGEEGSPIELAAYGTGDKPRIIRSDKAYDKCIVIEGPSYWNISDMDCRNAKLGLYLRYDLDYYNQDVNISNCYFKDMDNTEVNPADHDYELAWSTGIWLGGRANAFDPDHNILNGLTITNCGFDNCTTGFGTNWYFPPVFYSRLYDFTMEDCWATGILNGFIHLNHTTNGMVSRCRMLGGGGYFENGVTAGFMQDCEDITIDNCEIAYMTRDNCPDGVGFDFEGGNINCTFSNNVIHDCEGAAILVMTSGASVDNSGIAIEDCTFYNNALDASNSDNAYELKCHHSDNSGSLTNIGLYRSAAASGWISSRWQNFTKTNVRNSQYYSSVAGRASAWEFEQYMDLEGWDGFNQWDDNTVSDGVLYGLSTGGDPYAHSSPTWINIHEYPFVKIRMKQSAGTAAQVFFITETDPAWTEDKSVVFSITPDYEFHEYVIDMRQCPKYKGVVTQFRLDPTMATSSMMAIDYVRFSAN